MMTFTRRGEEFEAYSDRQQSIFGIIAVLDDGYFEFIPSAECLSIRYAELQSIAVKLASLNTGRHPRHD